MGNSDKWTTPKQIKIEREGEPRGTRRGPLKKGERRKGKKARIDELLSAKRDCVRYAEWTVEERKRRHEHPEWFKSYVFNWEKYFDDARIKLDKLLAKALADGVISPEEVEDFMVAKP